MPPITHISLLNTTLEWLSLAIKAAPPVASTQDEPGSGVGEMVAVGDIVDVGEIVGVVVLVQNVAIAVSVKFGVGVNIFSGAGAEGVMFCLHENASNVKPKKIKIKTRYFFIIASKQEFILQTFML